MSKNEELDAARIVERLTQVRAGVPTLTTGELIEALLARAPNAVHGDAESAIYLAELAGRIDNKKVSE
jgi:hypothetical protein